MIHIHAKDQETFLRSIGFNQVDNIEYVTVDHDDHRIEWHGLNGHDDEYRYWIDHSIYHTFWYRNGRLHRDDDLPAYINANGTQEWWVDGKRHRENDLPAIIYARGRKEWWVDGERHRDGNLPTIADISLV